LKMAVLQIIKRVGAPLLPVQQPSLQREKRRLSAAQEKSRPLPQAPSPVTRSAPFPPSPAHPSVPPPPPSALASASASALAFESVGLPPLAAGGGGGGGGGGALSCGGASVLSAGTGILSGLATSQRSSPGALLLALLPSLGDLPAPGPVMGGVAPSAKRSGLVMRRLPPPPPPPFSGES